MSQGTGGFDLPSYLLGKSNSRGKNSKKIEMLSKIVNGTYEGTDLTIKFADEIAKSPYNGDVWAWIQGRITAGNFDDIYVFDWIPVVADSHTYHAEVMGINTYKNYGDTGHITGNHIDFIFNELWHKSTIGYNAVNVNNGYPAFTPSGGTEQPEDPWYWTASRIYKYMNSLQGYIINGSSLPFPMYLADYRTGGVYYYLPANLKAVISPKRVYLPQRLPTSTALSTSDTSVGWTDLGNLWLPSENEIFGRPTYGTSQGSNNTGGDMLYPYFAVGSEHRVKYLNGERTTYWMRNARGGASTSFTIVSSSGYASYTNASNSHGISVCFRVMAAN